MSNQRKRALPEGAEPESTEPSELKDEELDQVSGGTETTSNNLQFLQLQTKLQNVSQTTQALSNIIKTDSDAKLNSTRNSGS